MSEDASEPKQSWLERQRAKNAERGVQLEQQRAKIAADLAAMKEDRVTTREGRRAQRDAAALAEAHSAWESQVRVLVAALARAREDHGGPHAPIVLQPMEMYFTQIPVNLIGERQQREYSGSYQGLSVPVARVLGAPVRANLGRGQGRSSSHPVSVAVDHGPLHITNQRLVFAGARVTQELHLRQVISLSYPDHTHLSITSSGTSAPTLVQCSEAEALDLQMAVALAHSDALGKREQLVQEMQASVDRILEAEPR